MTKPRTELFYFGVQTPLDQRYKPKKERDPDEIAHIEGKPEGIVIARNQRIGTAAMDIAFRRASEELGMVQSRGLVDTMAKVALGTAFHLYVERARVPKMYKRVRLVELLNPETGERLTEEELVTQVQEGLGLAAIQAEEIERLVLGESEHYDQDEMLGEQFTHLGMRLAVVDKSIDRWHGNAHTLQDASWGFAMRAQQMMIELSGQIQARPTVAQLPNPNSPLRRHLYDTREDITQPAYEILMEALEEAKAA